MRRLREPMRFRQNPNRKLYVLFKLERYSSRALTPKMVEDRKAFAAHVLELNHRPSWFYNNLVWIDPCSSILPRTENKGSELALARKGKKCWASVGTQECSRNLSGKKSSLMQKSWDTERVWWLPVLARGKLHLEVLPENFGGDGPEHVAILVEKARAAVNLRFQNDSKPSVLISDMGRGFYNPGTKIITPEYAAAVEQHGFTTFMGENACKQPGNMPDLMLHETAVAWVRKALSKSVPKQEWQETRDEFAHRLKQTARYINEELNVEGLCRGFPVRVKKLSDAGGQKLKY